MHSTCEHVTGPYERGALAYLDTGLGNPIPMRRNEKAPMYRGWSGREARTPARENYESWMNDSARANIAVCLAAGLLVVDVDHYGDEKRGHDCIHDLAKVHGKLPPTWIVSSRLDERWHAHFWYQYPDAALVHQRYSGTHVDLLKPGAAVLVPPSIHPTTGQMYLWTSLGGYVDADPPYRDDLPTLAESWGEHFRGECDCYLAEREERKWARLKRKARNSGTIPNEGQRRGALKILDKRAGELAAAPRGTRSRLLYTTGFYLFAQFVFREGSLTATEIWKALAAACTTNGLTADKGHRSVERTLTSAYDGAEQAAGGTR